MSHYHPYTIFPLGDSALTIEFSNAIELETNQKVLQLFQQICDAKIPYITDLVPAYSSLTVYYDVVSLHRQKQTAFELMAEMIENFTEEKRSLQNETSRLIEVPVCYDIAYAPDMNKLLKEKNLSAEEVISIHTSRNYRVYMLGFVPGFAYLGEVDEKIAMPRRQKPRLSVKGGSVGIAEKQTGIYPYETPGGWQIIGCTPLEVFNKTWTHPSLFNLGDEVKFYSITADEFKDYQRGNT